MFGSLVIVFPAPHEGGALKLRTQRNKEGERKEWTFDAPALLAQQTQPSVAYVAFFSDVEHEVAPVVSGHRVTLTYNLYHGDRRTLAPSARLEVRSPLNAVAYEVKDALNVKMAANANWRPYFHVIWRPSIFARHKGLCGHLSSR